MSTLPAAAVDLDAFFELSEFAFQAELDGAPLVVILTDFYSEMLGGSVNLGSTAPHVIAKESDVPDGSEGKTLQVNGKLYEVREVQRSNSGLTRIKPELVGTLFYEDTFNRADPAPWINTAFNGDPIIDATGIEAIEQDQPSNGIGLDLNALGLVVGEQYRLVFEVTCINWDATPARVVQVNLASTAAGTTTPLATVNEGVKVDVDHSFTHGPGSRWLNAREQTSAPDTSKARIQGTFRIWRML